MRVPGASLKKRLPWFHEYIAVLFHFRPMDVIQARFLWRVSLSLFFIWRYFECEIISESSRDAIHHPLVADPFMTASKQEVTNSTRGIQSVNSRQQSRLKAARDSVEETSLSALLFSVVQDEMAHCDLVLAHDDSYLYSSVVQNLLLMLPNSRQVGAACLFSLCSNVRHTAAN